MRASYQNVCVEALGFVLGEEAVRSDELERQIAATYERFGLAVGHLEALTGIAERRFFAPGTRPSEVATRAGRAALERAGRAAHSLGLVVSCSIDRDYFEPATACFVHRDLGLPPSAQALDVSNACLGFLSGMVLAADQIELGHIEAALVVAGEAGGLRAAVEGTLASLGRPQVTEEELVGALATLTLGAGGVAAVLSRAQERPDRPRLCFAVTQAASQYADLCRGQVLGPGQYLMATNMGGVLRRGVGLVKSAWAEACAHYPVRPFDFVFGHQVGHAQTQALCKALEVRPEQTRSLYPTFGNMGAAGLPLSWAMADAEGLLPIGAKVRLLGAGSGLNAAVLGVDG
jgi:acyl-CoA:acyl-CoA alkyltransferase